jgi:uncharacterized membrane protein
MGYINRLTRDLDRWIDQGWVAAEQRQLILADAGSRSRSWSAAGALAILGAVLLAMSALSFVAANWDGMPRIMRLGLILSALWATLLGSGRALDRGAPVLGHAIAVLGAALFGIAIMLTAQIFNMSSFRNTAVLIWTMAALAMAIILPSRPVLILGSLLGALWVGMETANPFMPDILWSYLPLWLTTAVLASRMRSLVCFNLLSFGLFVWISHAMWDVYETGRLSQLEWAVSETLIAATIALAGAHARDWKLTGGGVVAGWGASLTLVGGFVAQTQLENFVRWQNSAYQSGSPDERWAALVDIEASAYPVIVGIAIAVIIALAVSRYLRGALSVVHAAGFSLAAGFAALLPALTLAAGPEQVLALRVVLGTAFYALTIILILLGARHGRRFIGGLGIVGFIAQTLYVYSETFGDLLDMALFFLVGGLILFALCAGLMRWQKRLAGVLPPGQTGEGS